MNSNIEDMGIIKQAVEKPKIELSISTKGIYTWTIKLMSLDIDMLEQLNNDMLKRFKSEVKGEKNEINSFNL